MNNCDFVFNFEQKQETGLSQQFISTSLYSATTSLPAKASMYTLSPRYQDLLNVVQMILRLQFYRGTLDRELKWYECSQLTGHYIFYSSSTTCISVHLLPQWLHNAGSWRPVDLIYKITWFATVNSPSVTWIFASDYCEWCVARARLLRGSRYCITTWIHPKMWIRPIGRWRWTRTKTLTGNGVGANHI